MSWLHRALPSRERGAALIIVLAFVVLLTGLGVAYISRTTSDRQVAHSSFNQSSVDQVAQSAMDNIIGDLRQEIIFGSASPAPTFSANGSTFTLYVPTTCLNCTPTPYPGWNACPNSTPTILPIQPIFYPTPAAGTTPAIPNLIRRSVSSDPIPCPARASRASAVNSLADASANGRSVSLPRWNSHYMIPKSNTTDAGSDPITTGFNAPNYWAPDWVFVNDQGPTVIAAPDASVIGRYAYLIYDEGGLLDMNAAGYPSSGNPPPVTILQYGRKGSLAFADLTGLSSYGLSTTAVDNVVGWRNYASAQPSGTFPNFSFNTTAGATYYNFILSDPTNIQLTNYFTNSFLTTSQAPVFNTQTDQPLPARQLLIKLRSAVSGGGIGFVNALQYLGTFSREALSKIPQWSPTTPDSTNPNFQTLLATSSFTRNDGTTASAGEYLVNRRFLLQRLNWLTYKGPSATRTIPNSAPSLGNADYDMWLLTRPDVNSIRFSLTSAFLQQGTATNILNYFGLSWDTTNERWNYVGHNGSSTPIDSIATFGVGGTQAATREPDFFELLQAGIINNSLGDAASSDPGLPLVHQQSKMLHILTIGANLIAQSRADSYPVRIACTVNVGGTPKVMEAVGMPRLPGLSSLAVCPVGVTQNSGGVNWFLIPNLWDPFRDSWDLTEANAGNNGNKPLSTPGYLRPPVRITVSGNAGFGAATASQSGSVDPTSISAFSTTATGINLSLTLATGDSSFGRDGLREAMRLGASDISGSVTSFTPTNASSGFAWNDIVRPANDTSTYRPDHFVVFRLSLPGTGIPSGSTANPVLILQPGFQMRLEYQSPNGQWYPYSFLQGNNETTTTIGNTNPSTPTNLCLAATFSTYGQPTGYTNPTVVNSGAATLWSDVTGALAHAPMFAKSDPRSIRYNSLIGVINFANPPMTVNSAGIIGSIWPSPYATPPPVTPSGYPVPTPTPNPNPATLGDNTPAGISANPYNEFVPVGQTASVGDSWRPVMMNRPFRSVGEMGYAFRDQPFRTLSFSSSNSPDAGLLALFSTNDYSDSSGTRGGVINLNSRQAPSLAGVLTSTITREDTPRNNAGTSPSPSPLASPSANSVATNLTLSTVPNPVVNRAGLATLIANLPDSTGLGPSQPKTQRESIARALGEADQTRTWNLLIDVIAQSGRYPPNATNFQNGFVVNGEQRYWVHVAIDRFTGQVIDKQIEVVNE
jgi:hypothetical protein